MQQVLALSQAAIAIICVPVEYALEAPLASYAANARASVFNSNRNHSKAEFEGILPTQTPTNAHGGVGGWSAEIALSLPSAHSSSRGAGAGRGLRRRLALLRRQAAAGDPLTQVVVHAEGLGRRTRSRELLEQLLRVGVRLQLQHCCGGSVRLQRQRKGDRSAGNATSEIVTQTPAFPRCSNRLRVYPSIVVFDGERTCRVKVNADTRSR